MGCGVSGEAADYLEDGGLVDHGFVVGGEALVVAGAAPAADSGVGALDDPAAVRDVEAVAPAEGQTVDDLDLYAEFTARPVLVEAAVRSRLSQNLGGTEPADF